MFTVLHKDAQGHEALYAVRRVYFLPQPCGVRVETVDGEELQFADNGPEVRSNTELQPMIYVMNDAGKTVATYYL